MTSEGSTVTHIMTDIETSREREGGDAEIMKEKCNKAR